MIKRFLFVMMVGMISSTMWGQFYRETYFDQLGDVTGLTRDELKNSSTPVTGTGFVIKNGVFDASQKLMLLRKSIFKSMQSNRGISQREFSEILNSMGTFMSENPKERRSCYLALGYLYRNVIPLSLRDIPLSLQYYQNVLGMTPAENHVDRAQLYYTMADCVDPNMNETQMIELARYQGMAADEFPYYANGVGDIYLSGWGCFQDLFLSANMYDISQRYGNENSQYNAQVINYIIQHPVETTEDSLALINYNRFLYFLRIAQDFGRARQYAILSVQNGFAPACYALAEMHERIIPNLTMDQRRRDTYYWMRRGADMGYDPCIEGLARIATQYCIDTAKGAIPYDLANNQFSKKVQAECAKQAFEMRQRSMKNGNLISIRRLAVQYAKGNEFGYPKQDKKQAYILLTALTFYGNLRAEATLRELVKEYEIPANEEQEVDESVMRIILDLNTKEDDFLTRLNKQGDLYKPHYMSQWSNHEYNKEWGLTQFPMFWSHLIKTYQCAINYYSELKAQAKNAPGRYRAVSDAYCDKRIEQLKARLREY